MYFAVALLFCLMSVGWMVAIIARIGREYLSNAEGLSQIAIVSSLISTSLAIWLYPIGTYWGVIFLYIATATPIAIIPISIPRRAAILFVCLLMFEAIADPPTVGEGRYTFLLIAMSFIITLVASVVMGAVTEKESGA
ncbi:MAG: hypothetical protein V1807_02000 [Patescibacteria group bacterium]